MSTSIFIASGDLSESMRNIIEDTFIRVDGILVEKRGGDKYLVLGKTVTGMDAVKETIKQSAGNLQNSIK